MGWDGMGRDGIGRDGMRWGGVGRNEIMRWDETVWDGTIMRMIRDRIQPFVKRSCLVGCAVWFGRGQMGGVGWGGVSWCGFCVYGVGAVLSQCWYFVVSTVLLIVPRLGERQTFPPLQKHEILDRGPICSFLRPFHFIHPHD